MPSKLLKKERMVIMSITKCMKQAKFHMGYAELVEKYPERKSLIDAIAWVIAAVFAETNNTIKFGGVEECPTAQLRKRLGYLDRTQIEDVVANLTWQGNMTLNIQRALRDVCLPQ